MKKKGYWGILLIIIVALLAFLLGYFLNQPERFNSCASAYNNLLENDICSGKTEAYLGTNEVIGNVTFFNYNWQEDLGSYGNTKEYIGGVNKACQEQAQRQFIETGERQDLINCFANEVEIKDNILVIQCGCFFG